MNQYQVTCINKPDRNSTHEHITHIGNSAGAWRLTREEAIKRIDAKKDGFYTLDPVSKNRAEVGVVREMGTAPFLRTYADGQWNNNLLSLPECDTVTCTIVG